MVYVNGRHLPSEGLTLNTACAKTFTMAYQKLFSGLDIRHGNAGIQITPDLYVKDASCSSLISYLTVVPRTVTQVSPRTAAFASNSNSIRLSAKP